MLFRLLGSRRFQFNQFLKIAGVFLLSLAMVVSKISSCFGVLCSKSRFFAMVSVKLIGVANYFQGFLCGAIFKNSFGNKFRFFLKVAAQNFGVC